MFIDPAEEHKARIEKEKLLKKKEAPVIKLKDGSTIAGGLHPSTGQGSTA